MIMIPKLNNIIRHNNDLLLIKAIYNTHVFKNTDITKKYQSAINCTHILMIGEYYYFCELIEEPEIIEDK